MNSAALYLPLVGALVVIVSAIIARTTARDIATLGARQKRVEFELGILDEYRAALLDASLKIQHYTWYGGDIVDNKLVDQDEFEAKRDIFEPTTTALQTLRLYGDALIEQESWRQVRDTYAVVIDVFDRVVMDVDSDPEDSGRKAWSKAVSAQPDPIVLSHRAVADLRLALIDSYPSTAPDSLGDRLLSVWHPHDKH